MMSDVEEKIINFVSTEYWPKVEKQMDSILELLVDILATVFESNRDVQEMRGNIPPLSRMNGVRTYVRGEMIFPPLIEYIVDMIITNKTAIIARAVRKVLQDE